MKIGITCYPTYGGSGAVATELGLELARRGHKIHFISYSQPFRLTNFIDGVYFHEVKVNNYPLFEYPPYSFALAVSMHEVAAREGLDVIHAHYAIPHATAAWMAREMLREEGRDVKLVTTLHGTDITLVGKDPSYRSVTQFSLSKSDALTAVSTWLRDRTVAEFDFDGREIQVIPNFVQPRVYDRDRYAGSHVWGAPGEKVLMHISNFRPVKRIPDLVRVFAAVRESIPAKLVLVGDGPERVAAGELAERMGVRKDVVMLGKVDSVAELLANADLFLLPSAQESFGLVALEAHAAGVPVIGAGGSGLEEVVSDGESGALLPVGDVEGMAAASIRFLTDPQALSGASAAAREAAARFATGAIVPQYEALYGQVTGL